MLFARAAQALAEFDAAAASAAAAASGEGGGDDDGGISRGSAAASGPARVTLLLASPACVSNRCFLAWRTQACDV
jgi:hypothetical protein